MNFIKFVGETLPGWKAEECKLASPALKAFGRAHIIVHNALDSVKEYEGSEGLVFHTFGNILSRIEAQTEGMFVSFCSGCTGASETLARTVVESCVNFLFMLGGNHEKRLFAYFRAYIRDHGKALEKWSAANGEIDDKAVKMEVSKLIEQRRIGLGAYAGFIQPMASDLGISDVASSDDWPNQIKDRFRATGHTISYLTVYHRLSSTSHGDAEGTIRWLMGVYRALESGDHSMMRAMQKEDVHFSAMMLLITVQYYVEVSTILSRVCKYEDSLEELEAIFFDLTARIHEISQEAGSPSTS